MRIAVNTQHLLKDRLEGIGWFAHEVLSRLVLEHPEHEFIFIFDRKWDTSFIYAENVIPVKTIVPSRHPILWWWHYEVDIPLILKKFKPDLFFSPDGWMSLKTNIPSVDTIHDINFIHRSKDFPVLVRLYYKRYFRRYAKKAKRLVTVSEYSKSDIVRHFKIAPEKIDVAHNGCNSIYSPVSNDLKIEIRNKYTEGNPFFIYVGSINPRKNLRGLLKAFDKFKEKDTNNYRLLLVGEAMWESSYLADQLGGMKYRDSIEFTGRISNEVLHLIMASADALMMVSFYEGFGIPVIEAMHCDVPVICSNVTALPEVAGEAALFVNPESEEEIADAMYNLSKYPELRQSLIIKGREQRKKFSWDNTAAKVWSSIEKALK